MNRIKRSCLLLTTVALALSLLGCTHANEPTDNADSIFRDNEIISYEPLDTDKLLIRVANYMNVNSDPLEAALEAKFPNVEIVISVGGGMDYLRQLAQNDEMQDIVFYSAMPDMTEFFYDLSAQSFTSRYNLTSLNSLSVDGKIYQLPVASSGMGIFYNKTLFDEKGWAIPQTLDEFYALCEQISAEGIRPFAPCFKYASTVADVGLGLSSQELFGDLESATHIYEFADGINTAEGVMEPFLTVLRDLYARGLVTEKDFTSSATQNRLAMYEGEIAMVPYTLNLASFYDEEQPDCELGFMGFPTDTPGEHALALSHDGTCMGLARHSMEDPAKADILLEILDYLTTAEGQDVLFQCFTGISSVKSYQSNIATRFDEVLDCIDQGRMYFPPIFWDNDDLPIIQEWVTGDMAMADMLTAMDQMVRSYLEPAAEAPVIGTATDDFSIMEACAFMADAFRETTGADIALVLDNTTYKGLLMKVYKGDVTFPEAFYIRGMSDENCLTTYEISGRDLKALMEHPIVNGEEINAAYVPSGLLMTYAPWKDRNENVLSLTLADGSELDDDTLYTVAAWDTSIAEEYINRELKRYESINNTTEYMTQVITAQGTISPPRDGRITLDWEQR